MPIFKKIIGLAAALLTCLSFAFADKDKAIDPSEFIVKAPEASPPPKIDGKLEDEFWESAVTVENFTQFQPREGAEPSERTVAYIGYDSNNLYIAVRCYDSNPKAVRACLTQRDKVLGDDEVTIYLDTFNDKKRAFAFQINPCGVQSDGVYNEVRRRGRGGGGWNRIDKNWDTFFHTDATIDEEGYVVEMSIPFKSIRFPDSDSQTWGFQIQRNIRRKNEEIYWHPRTRNINGFLVQSGQLQIEGTLKKGKNLEIMPVVTGLKDDTNKAEPEAGINLKYGITSNLTTDLTINPDYSQIEADMPQIDVNQRFALYFPETRPFFLEGKDYYDTPLQLMYTRTIAEPYWGAKITGKMGGTTLGFLSSYDASPTDINIPDAPDQEGNRGFVNVLRMKQDLFSESYIGFILTDKETGADWSSITSNYNRVAGVDGHFKFLRYNRFSFQVVGSKSKVNNQETDIVPAMIFDLSHRSRHWSLSANYTHLPPDFEASLGFFRRKDIRQIRSRLSYSILPMKSYLISVTPSVEYRRAYDFEDTLTDEEVRVGGFISGWRNSTIWGGYTWEMERYGDIDFQRKGWNIRFSSEPLSWVGGMANYSESDSIYYSSDPYLGYKISYGGMIIFRPMTNLRLFYSYSNNTFSESRGGEQVYKINIVSQRIAWQMSRQISLRLITDWNDYYKTLFNSILFSYQLNPGTVFYLGMDDNREQDEFDVFQKTGRFYFVKFSYWWRI